MNIKSLYKLCDTTFSKRSAVMSLWQNISDQFYPERSGFTVVQESKDEFASHLMTSFPVICRRELGDAFSSMLRRDEWFAPRTLIPDIDKDLENRAFFDERLAPAMRRLMADQKAGFARATTEVDHDLAAFGNGVMSVDFNRHRSGLLYRAWHLRDVCWTQDETGEVNAVFHKMKLTASEIMRRWGEKIDNDEIKKAATEDPGKEFEIHRYVVSSEMIDDERFSKWDFVSMFLDPKKAGQGDCECLEMTGSPDTIYIIPRWKILSGSQYGFSPAAQIALADARMIQEMVCILLESGQKSIDPAVILNRNVFREDFDFEPSGITMADIDGDGDIRKAYAELQADRSGMGQWMQQVASVRQDLEVVWYRNLLRMPATNKDMTAYEVSEIVNDHLRQTLPLFQPIEHEWSFRICDMTLTRMLQANMIPLSDIPEGLQKKQIKYEFVSPMSDLAEKKKVQIFMQGQQIIAQAIAVDPSVADIVDWDEATREALLAGQTPASWLRSASEVEALAAQRAQDQQTQQLLSQMQQGASVAKDLSQAMPKDVL